MEDLQYAGVRGWGCMQVLATTIGKVKVLEGEEMWEICHMVQPKNKTAGVHPELVTRP